MPKYKSIKKKRKKRKKTKAKKKGGSLVLPVPFGQGSYYTKTPRLRAPHPATQRGGNLFEEIIGGVGTLAGHILPFVF